MDEPTTEAATDRDGQAAALPAEVVEGLVLRASHRRHRRPGRSRAVNVLYDDAEFAQVRAAAAVAGLTPTGFVAVAALAACDPRPDAPPVAYHRARDLDRAVLGELMQLRTGLRRYGVLVNQAVAALHANGQAPSWLRKAVSGCDRAVADVDELALRLARQLRGR